MKGFLSQRGISYTDRDISSDETALAELTALGYLTTPVTTIDGTIVVGFDQARLAQLLDRPAGGPAPS